MIINFLIIIQDNYMKKISQKKRLLACMAVIMMLQVLLTGVKVQAAVSDDIPTTARIYTYKNEIQYQTKRIALADIDESVTNVKSNSRKLKVGICNSMTSVPDSVVLSHHFDIGMIALADGVYTVTYDIEKNGEIVSSNKMKVYAYPSPLQKFTIDGEETTYYKDKKQAKLTASFQQGNPIVEMTAGSFITDKVSGQRPVMKYTTFKNGSKVRLGTTCDTRKLESGDRMTDSRFWGNFSTSLESYTEINIVYKDKYTKQKETLKLVLNGWMK